MVDDNVNVYLESALFEIFGLKTKITDSFIKKNKSMFKIDLNILEQDLTRIENLILKGIKEK